MKSSRKSMSDSLSDEHYKKRIKIESKLTKSIFKILGKLS